MRARTASASGAGDGWVSALAGAPAANAPAAAAALERTLRRERIECMEFFLRNENEKFASLLPEMHFRRCRLLIEVSSLSVFPRYRGSSNFLPK